jgi:hypothetical protein
MLSVLKSRQSWHSELTYPYRFVLGIGIVLDTTEMDGKRMKKLTPEMKLAITNTAANLPKREAEQIKNLMKYLERADLGDMPLEQIVDMLIEEYKGEEKVMDEPKLAS